MSIKQGQIFLDETESGASYVLGGWVSSKEFWEIFSGIWKQVLEAERRLDYFKWSEGLLLRKQFQDWTAKERDDKFEALIKIFPHDDGKLQGVACHVTQALFKNFVKPRMRRPWNISPYFISTSVIMLWTVEQYKNFDQIDFILDRDKCKRSSRVREFFYKKIKPMNPRFGECFDLSDKEWMPLQAADMLAAQARQMHEPRPMFHPAVKKLNGILTSEIDLDEPSLDYLFEQNPYLKTP